MFSILKNEFRVFGFTIITFISYLIENKRMYILLCFMNFTI